MNLIKNIYNYFENQIYNYFGCRQLKKHIKDNPPDPIMELRHLMDADFTQRQALAILNAIANMQRG